MISAPKRPGADPALGNVTPQKLDTNEQSRVVPYFAHFTPLNEPDCVLILRPGKRPTLVRLPPANSPR